MRSGHISAGAEIHEEINLDIITNTACTHTCPREYCHPSTCESSHPDFAHQRTLLFFIPHYSRHKQPQRKDATPDQTTGREAQANDGAIWQQLC